MHKLIDTKKKKYILILILITISIAIAVVLFVFLSNQFRFGVLGDNSKSEGKVIKKERPQTVLEQVSKLVDLPKDETPTITTVTDINKLASQPFFKNAKNGDRVLIYTRSGIAIIYRPSTNKIIEYSNVDLIK